MIPTQEMINFPVFAANGAKIQPDTAKYSAGFQEADVLPAEYLNFLENKSSSAITTLNAGVASLEEEVNAVVSAGGETPSASDNSQLLKSIQYMINQSVFNAALAAYPVGAYYWSSDPKNPSEIFGGTWTQIQGRAIIAAGTTTDDNDNEMTFSVGETGGNFNVKLAESNLPAHDHGMKHRHKIEGSTGYANTNHSHEYLTAPSKNGHPDGAGDSGSPSYWRGGNETAYTPTNYADHCHSIVMFSKSACATDSETEKTKTDKTGSSNSFSILTPYEVAYCWRRTA